jgi:hypothetical protein
MEDFDIIIPKWLERFPFVNDWVQYKGETFYGMVNLERSEKANRPIIDLCYCATSGLINNRVLKTVQFDKNKFKPSHLSDQWKA